VGLQPENFFFLSAVLNYSATSGADISAGVVPQLGPALYYIAIGIQLYTV